jgi:hypothetical protein
MRAAIPVWNDCVAPVFDAATRLVLVDVENRVEQGRREQVLSDTFLARWARRLADVSSG